MKTENWLNCRVHAFNYYGGVIRLLIPINCKTAIISNTRYDTVLNRRYQGLPNAMTRQLCRFAYNSILPLFQQCK